MKVSENVKRGPKKWLSTGLLLAGTSLLLVACGSGQQSIGNSIDLEFTGYNGDGVVSYENFDFYKEVYEISLRQAGINKSDAEAVAEGDAVVIARLNADTKQATKLAQAQTLASSVTYELSEYSGLSNGDTVVLTIKTSSKESPVKDEVKEFTVEGLKEYEVVKIEDLLQQDNVRVAGFDGYGQLNVGENSYSEIFDIEGESTNLKNGDKVTVKVDEDYLSTLKAEGKTVDETSVEYEIKELSPLESITNLKDLQAKIDTLAKSKNENSSSSTYTLEKQKDYIGYTYGYDEGTSGKVTLVTVYKITADYKYSDTTVNYRSYGYTAYIKKDGSLDLETANEYYGTSSQDYEYLISNLEASNYKEYVAKAEEKTEDKVDEKSEEKPEDKAEEKSEDKSDDNA